MEENCRRGKIIQTSKSAEGEDGKGGKGTDWTTTESAFWKNQGLAETLRSFSQVRKKEWTLIGGLSNCLGSH